MDTTDFTGLAARAVAGLDEVRACLLASRDGLTLAALPEGREGIARRALDRLETVGQPERGFLVIGDEVWVVARRGPYLGIVVALASARAGLLLDRLESTLRAAEESRLLAGSAGAMRPEAPRRPRTPLHREKPEPPRPDMTPSNSLFEEVARVVSVPEKEAHAPEASVTEAPVAPSFRQVMPERETPSVGGPGSEPGPPPIVHPEPESAEPKVEAPQPEPVVEVVAPEPEEPKVEAPQPEPEEPKVEAPEPGAERPNLLPLEHEPEAPNVVREPEAVEAPPIVEPIRAEGMPPAPTPEGVPRPPQKLAHPEVEPPKATPHYSPPDALLGEMGRVVADETTPVDIFPPGVSAPETPVPLSDAADNGTDEPPGAKKPEISKERTEDTEVDPVALAREFSQLFDEPERDS